MVSPTNIIRRKRQSDLPLFISQDCSNAFKLRENVNGHLLKYILFGCGVLFVYLFLCCFPDFSKPLDFINSRSTSVDNAYEYFSSITPKKSVAKTNYSSSVIRPPERSLPNSIPFYVKFSDSPLSDGILTHPDDVPLRNIVFFSFHGRVGSSYIMNILAENFNFINGGEFKLKETLSGEYVPEPWSQPDQNMFTDINKVKTEHYIRDIFYNHGEETHKMLSVHMTDAWSNEIDISWLIQALTTIGKVSHIIMIGRNPLRVKISEELGTKYRNIFKESQLSCDTHKFLFEISRKEAVDMTLAQYHGFKDALVNRELHQLGLSYEADIHSDVNRAIQKITNFLLPDQRARVPNIVTDYESHYHCPLSVTVFNFKELQCAFAASPLSWVVDENEDLDISFMDMYHSYKDYLEWERRARSKGESIDDYSRCRSIADFKSLQQHKVKLSKTIGRCGHGGHGEGTLESRDSKCIGYGKMREFMCAKLLELSNGSCDSLTYNSGECYLHNESAVDYWEGYCNSDTSYHAYILTF